MTDDRRRAAETPVAASIPSQGITPGQRVPRAFLEHASDSTLDMPAVTPALVAAGSRGGDHVDPLAGTSLGRPAGASGGGAPGAAAAAPPPAGGTLELPASDQVVVAGDLDPGQVLGHFVIRARLGEGGMGMVLAAHDADLGRQVALKVVKTSIDHPAYRARLLREAQAMARLEHPNVVRVYEVGSDRGRLFVAMQFIDGVTLTTWLRVQRRPWREIVAMFEQVGAGLAAVHRAGLVHRDFKPDNVLVDRDGRARVVDFGLARVDPDAAGADPSFAPALTRTGMLLGTPGYMAPEQHLGGDVDGRADQYSFCVALREALVGGRPAKLEDRHWGKVPRAVRAVIARGASVDADARFGSMDELLVALSRATHRRRATIGAIAAGVVVTGSIAAAVIASGTDDAGRATDAAPTVTAARSPSAGDVTTPPDTRAGSVPASPDTRAGSVPAGPDTRAGSVPAGPDTRAGSVPAGPAKGAATTVADASGRRSARAAAGAEAGERGSVRAGAGTSAAIPRSAAAAVTDGGTPGTARAAEVTTTMVTPMAPPPVSKAAAARNATSVTTRHEMIASHRALVRDAVRDLGYGGLQITGDDRDADLRELEGKLAASTDDLERGMLLYAMGQNERLREDCIGAARYWRDARKLVLDAANAPLDARVQERRTQAFRFYGRIVIAESLCELRNGHALGVDEMLRKGTQSLFGVPDTERAQAWFATAIAILETGGGTDEAERLLELAGRRGDAKLREAIAAYAAAVGLARP